MVAVAHRAGLQPRRIEPGIGFGYRETGLFLAGDQRRQKAALLLVGAEDDNRVQPEDIHVDCRGAAEPGSAFGDRLHQHRRLGDAEPAAAKFLWHRNAEPPRLGHRPMKLVRKAALGILREPIIVAEAGAQPRDRGPDLLLLSRQRKVHRCLLAARRVSTWRARPYILCRTRPWRPALPLDIVPSVCPHDCPSACALEVERIGGMRIGRVRGAFSQTYTRGVVCAKVARYAERQHHPDRLSQPLRRIGDKGVGRAAFAPISWDDALDEVAEQLTRAARQHGSEAVWPYFYAGTMGMVQRDGVNRLRHAMRYSREDLTICNALTDAGWLAAVGVKRGVDGREIANADLIVVWGGNPVSTQVNVMTHIAAARKERGAKLVVIDPYRTASAAAADLHLAPLPGTDGALACAVMHILFKEGYADRAYMARYADDPVGLEAHLATRGPAWAAAITGLGEAAIVDFARL